MPAATTPAPFHVMTKPNGPRCNIDCKYCYYLEKETLYPSEKKFRMSDAVLERYVTQMISATLETGQREVLFAWHGGEPTILGLPYYRKIAELQRRHCPPGITILNTMQTNGTLLDDDWGQFLADNGVLVGISIDGPKSVHDRYRVDRQGRPTFDATMRGLDVLRRHGVEYNILATVHRGNAAKGKEIYRFLRVLGSPHLQFIPIVERSTTGGGLASAPQVDSDPSNVVTQWSVAPRAYGKFLCDVFDVWYRHDVGDVFVQYFETQLGLWLGQPSSLCLFAQTCGNALALEHNGDLYACDHYVYPEYRLGNVMETDLRDLVWSKDAVEFGTDKATKLTGQCLSCKFRFACNGGCPKHRILTSRDGQAGHNYFCESYTMFFRHAGPRLQAMADNLRMGRPVIDPREAVRPPRG